VESHAKEFITAGQYLSIIRRISVIKNDLDRSKALEYIEEIVTGAEYKKQLSTAKAWIKSLKQKADKFGTGGYTELEGKTVKDMVATILKANIKALSYEELIQFNQVAALIDIRSMNPKIWHIQQLSNIAEKADVSDISKKDITQDSLREDITEYKKNHGGKLTSRKEIIAAQRALTRIRNKYIDYLKANKISEVSLDKDKPSELEVFVTQISELVGNKNVDGELQAMIDAEKAEYIKNIIKNMSSKKDDILRGLRNIPPVLEEKARRMLAVTKDDLSKLNLAEVEAFDTFVQNLSHGYMNEVAATLDLTIGTNRLKSKTLDRFFLNLKDSKQFNNWIAKYYEGRETRKPFSRRVYNVQTLLQEAIWSRQAHRIDTWLGNYDKDHTIGSIYNYVGRGVSRESITTRKFDEQMQLAKDDIDKMYSKTVRGERLYMTDAQKAQRDRKMSWIGMVLAEMSYQAMDVKMDGIIDGNNASVMRNNYVTNAKENLKQENNKRKFLENKRHYNALMDYLRENNAVKEVEGVEIMDSEKALELLKKEKPVRKYIETLHSVLDQMKGMAAWSTFSNGRAFVELDNYFPFVVIQNKSMLDVDKLREAMNIGRVPAKMQAGATYERSGAANYLEINPQIVMKRYVEEIARNYHVYGEMKKALGAVIESGREASEKETGDKPIFHNLTKTIIADIKLRIDQHYGMNSFSGRAGMMNWGMKAVKLGILPTIYRPIIEFVSNGVRAFTSTGAIPHSIFAIENEHRETYAALIEDFIGEKYMSRWGEEIRGSLFENKTAKQMEQMARGMVTFADTKVGRPLFVYTFNSQFKKLSGKDFDPVLYNNIAYKVENEQYVEKAAVRAVRKVEELFNDKAPISAPTHLRFWSGLWVPRRDSMLAQWFGFLMSFNRNEVAQVVDSYKRIKYSDVPGDAAQGRRDIAAIVLSNTLYGILRTGAATLLLKSSSLLLGLLTGEDDDDKRLKKRVDALKKFEFYQDKLLGSFVDLGLGGSAQLSLFMYRWGMYAADKGKWFDEKTREKVKNFMAKEMYQRHIPTKMSFDTPQTIVASLPVPSALTEEIFNLADDAITASQVLDFIPMLDIIDGTANKEEVTLAWVSLFLTGLKLGMPNGVSPTAQIFFNNERRKRLEKMKSDGVENPEVELFNQEFETIFGTGEDFFEEIETIEGMFNDLDW
jgi:hypothetical protein